MRDQAGSDGIEEAPAQIKDHARQFPVLYATTLKRDTDVISVLVTTPLALMSCRLAVCPNKNLRTSACTSEEIVTLSKSSLYFLNLLPNSHLILFGDLAVTCHHGQENRCHRLCGSLSPQHAVGKINWMPGSLL